jgi:alpha-tubulin suppressor-like RCC1 family protein
MKISRSIWLGLLLAMLVIGCESSREAPSETKLSALGTSPVTPSLQLSDFALLAERSLRLSPGARVMGGAAGVLAAAPLSFGPQARLGHHATIGPHQWLLAPSVRLEAGAAVGTVLSNSVDNVSGKPVLTLPFPQVLPSLPLAAAGAPGTLRIDVDRKQELELLPGNYGAAEVWGTLVLAAGQYSFESLSVGAAARVLARAPGVDVRVASTLSVGAGARIGGTRGRGLSQHYADDCDTADVKSKPDLRFEVAARGDEPAQRVVIGPKTRIRALVSAPHTRITLGEGAEVRGALAAFDLVLEAGAHVTLSGGFMAETGGQFGKQKLSGFLTAQGLGAATLGPLPADTPVALSIGLPIARASELAAFARDVSNPKSPGYRRFLAPFTLGDRFGTPSAEYATLSAWASSFASTTTYSNRLLLDTRATARNVEQAFHVNLVRAQRSDGSEFYAPDQQPSVDLELRVQAVTGLDDFHKPIPSVWPHGPPIGVNLASGDFRDTFLGVGTSCANQFGAGQSIGLVLFDGFTQSNVDQYVIDAEITVSVPAVQTLLAGTMATPYAPSGTRGSFEADLDVQMATAMAPAAQVVAFEGTNIDSVLAAVLDSPDLLQISSSWLAWLSAQTPILANALVAQGQAFFVASGDWEAYEPPSDCPSSLASDPEPAPSVEIRALENVTLVGGTHLFHGMGTTDLQGVGVTGGGVIPSLGLPAYQAGIFTAANASEASTSHRNAPDVSLVANSIYVVSGDGEGESGSGTSAASPLWAGFLALANEQSALNGLPPVGFINPTVYAIGEHPDVYALSFDDPRLGSACNTCGTCLHAFEGYDLATGLGSPVCGLIGQLASTTPTVAAGSPNPHPAIALSVGSTDACAVLSPGAAYCWGADVAGQLGNGSGHAVGSGLVEDFTRPSAVLGLSGATRIVASSAMSCALLLSGGVKCWGNNGFSSLGNDSDVAFSTTPVSVAGITDATDIAVAGPATGCALLADGSVKCWGYNVTGQLGNPSVIADRSATPVLVSLPGPAALPHDAGHTLAGGNDHFCVVMADASSTIRCWGGGNGHGQLGNGSTTSPGSTPVAVTGLTGAVAVSAGYEHTCAVLSTGQVACWGSNFLGQTSDPTQDLNPTPVLAPGITTATAIAAGMTHSCAVIEGGAVWCWGDNVAGQLGRGTVDVPIHPTPEPTLIDHGAVFVANGGLHSCALMTDGSLRCWGDNASGALGIGIDGGVESTPLGVQFL